MAWYAKCSLCGAPCHKQPNHWMNEIRVIYVIRRVWHSPLLSGVGLHIQDTLRVPPQDHQRYDDPDHVSSSDITIDPFLWHATTIIPNEIITWGAMFHDSCWNLLVEASRPNKIDVSVLHRVFLSFPLDGGLLDWGHDYRGCDEETIGSDPFKPPELVSLLDTSMKERTESRRLDQTSAVVKVTSLFTNDSDGDPFVKLPPEVRENILILLPSEDVKSLRATSRAVADLKLSQKFWASRFGQDSAFDCIFETQKSVSVETYRSWRDLFFGLRLISNGSALRNRKRVWSLLKPFSGLLSTYLSTPCDGRPVATFWEPHLEERSLEWQCLKPCHKLDPMRLNLKCRMLLTRQVCLDFVTGVYVSVISHLDDRYVCGLRFSQPGGADVRLGFILPGREDYLDILGQDIVSDGIGGFILAISSRGINAISLVSGTGYVSDWAGSHKGSRRRCLLAKKGSTYNLRADFDVR